MYFKNPGAPVTYFNDIAGGGGGGVRVIFCGSEILAKSDFFGVYERCQDFLGSREKAEGYFWVVKKGLRYFFGYAKKSSDVFRVDKF